MADHTLFYSDNDSYFAMTHLREVAAEVVRKSSLIRRCEGGDRRAAEGLYQGFWYFVSEFEKAIDARKMPRLPLYARFGVTKTRAKLVDTSRAIRGLREEEFSGVFANIAHAVREMQQEEATHARHWIKDAENLGIGLIQMQSARVVAGVKNLVDRAYCEDMSRFFSVLAATEFIAEELAARLAHARSFTSLFRRKRAIWMEVHTIPHDHGPSHLEIDMDLARAYALEGSKPVQVESMVLDIIYLFGQAADDVEKVYAAGLVAAE